MCAPKNAAAATAASTAAAAINAAPRTRHIKKIARIVRALPLILYPTRRSSGMRSAAILIKEMDLYEL